MIKVIGDYRFNQSDDWLGSGSFATVYKGVHIATSETVAIKEINVARLLSRCRDGGVNQLRKALETEITTMRMFHHENIIQLIDVVRENSMIYMIVEYCAGGDLTTLLKQNHMKGLSEAVVHQVTRQLVDGLKYMHYLGIAHRDLKPQNILLSTRGEEIVVKIADFGFARALKPNQITETICGSPLYMAPEVLEQPHKYTSSADIWSLGAILYELLVASPPFHANNILELTMCYQTTREVQLPIWLNVSKLCRNFVMSLLVVNPKNRIEWNTLFQHPWLLEQNYGPITITVRPTVDPIAGSAPGRLQDQRIQKTFGRLQQDELLIKSFEIVSDDLPKQPKSPRVGDMCRELHRWLTITKTLYRLTQQYRDQHNDRIAYELLTHSSTLIRVILDTIVETDPRLDHCDELYLIQFRMFLNRCQEQLDELGSRSESPDHNQILFDVAMSMGKHGDVYHVSDRLEESREKYLIVNDLLESLIPFSNTEGQEKLRDKMTQYRYKIEDATAAVTPTSTSTTTVK